MQKELMEKFVEVYGEGGEIREYFAPGRVNLIGEHTDYNGGHVFPCALTLGTYGLARKRDDRKLRFYSVNFSRLGVIESSLDDLIPSDQAGWTNYPKGVMWAFRKKKHQAGAWCGFPDLRKYSKWFRTFFFCVSGSSYRSDAEGYVWRCGTFHAGSGSDRTVFREQFQWNELWYYGSVCKRHGTKRLRDLP